MRRRTKAKKTFLLIKLSLTMIILLSLSRVGVMAVTSKVNTVNITLSNGYTLTVLTRKTNVADILKDNNILVSDDEKVVPSENENITDDNTIVISNKSKQEVEVAKVSESGVESNLEDLLSAYSTVTEKIVTEKEDIPYETVKKDVSDGASSTKNVVIQKGENGVKEVTYKVKYQNDTEIEKNKISEKVIKKPVDKIVQVNSNVVTSRSSTTTRDASPSNSSSSTSSAGGSVIICKVTAYCSCPICCGRGATGRTASGTMATAGRTVATSSKYSFGTKLLINGKEYVVEDRGGAIQGNRIDIYMNSHSAALAFGVKYLPVQVEK